MTAQPSPLALAFIIIGAIMGFGREPLGRFYAWLAGRWRKEPLDPRLAGIFRLYLAFTSLTFTVAGLLGLLGIIKM